MQLLVGKFLENQMLYSNFQLQKGWHPLPAPLVQESACISHICNYTHMRLLYNIILRSVTYLTVNASFKISLQY